MKIQPIRICKTKVAFPVIIASLLFTLTLSACNSFDTRPQKLADALGATPNNTMAHLKLTLNITDHYQHIYFKGSGEVTNNIVEQAVRSIDPSATILPGKRQSYAQDLNDSLTMSWSKADPKNLRVISGKDIFRDSVQNTYWSINWSSTRNPQISDVLVYFIAYDATNVALEMDGNPITGPVIIIETGRE